MAGDAAIDHVEQTGADDDESALEEFTARKQDGGKDIDEQADERENVRVDSGQGQAVDDQQNDLVATSANRACDGHD